MLLDFAGSLLVFFGITLGVAWPVAARLKLDPAEKIGASIALSIIGVFLFGWAIYVFTLPLAWFWLLVVAAIAGIGTEWRSLGQAMRGPETSKLVVAQGIITLWSVGWLALVLGYSGGGWTTDWHTHMQRTWFFLDHGPKDFLFGGFDALTSRPPLANVVNGALLMETRKDFAHYQFFSTLLGSLAFFPAGLLARRFGGSRAIAVLAVLFMVNPMYVQNATFAWTKLPAAFFTLTALYFFLRAYDDHAPPVSGVLFAVTLAAGLLAHYSAGPYAVLLGIGWLALGRRKWNDREWRRTTFIAASIGGLILATWFGWAFAIYGLQGSLLTNSSVTDAAPDAITQLTVVILNVRDTLVPHFLRTLDFELLAQRSSAGWWRDWFFQIYQSNFLFVFGSVAWMAILFHLCRQWRSTSSNRRVFWLAFILGNTFLGIAVHGGRYAWGLAHICLQPLILLGLAFLAAQWGKLGRRWQLALVAGATVDFALGILLQFGVQAYALERWISPGRSVFDIAKDYSQSAQMNFYAKTHNRWIFVGDLFVAHSTAIIVFLAALFLYALSRVERTPAGSVSAPEGKVKIRQGE